MSKDYEPGADWKLIWSDEFDEDVLDEMKWNRQIVEAGRFNEEWQRYTDHPENATVKDGKLILKALHIGKEHGEDFYTSARLNTAGKFTFRYGKVAARIKLPSGKGIWPAFWMLGADIDENGGSTPWPLCGEIDILELYGTESVAVVEANIHYAGPTGAHTQMGAVGYTLEKGSFSDDFHLFELIWNEEEISWQVDGHEYASVSITSGEYSAFHGDFFLILNIAVGGTWAGRPDESTPFPQSMYIDWIRVYQTGD